MHKSLKIGLRVASLLFAFVFVFSLCFNCEKVSAGDTELQKLRENLRKATANKESARQAYNEAKNKLSTVTERKKAIDSELYALQSEIDVLEKLGSEYESQISYLSATIEKLSADVDEKTKQIKEQLRYSYEDGDAGYLDIFFSSSGIDDFLINIERATLLYKYNAQTVAECNNACIELKGTMAELEKLRSESNEKLRLLDESENELEAKSNEAYGLMQELGNDASSALKQYNEMEAAISSFNSDIEKLLVSRNQQGNIKYVGGSLMWPLPLSYTNVSSGFGYRTFPAAGYHLGIDIPAPINTPIYAANTGTVIETGEHWANGRYIIIDHGGGIATMYCHLTTIGVINGQSVKKGATIGYVGMTGFATGYHLHFTVYENNTAVDPMKYFK